MPLQLSIPPRPTPSRARQDAAGEAQRPPSMGSSNVSLVAQVAHALAVLGFMDPDYGFDDDEPEDDGVSPTVICKLSEQLYAFPADIVETMVQIADVNRVPQLPSYVRGVINLRGTVLQVIDLRARLGLPSLTDEVTTFSTMMDERMDDHERWLAELRQAVEERRPFAGQTDPTKCAFGRWYDGYHTSNTILASLLSRFDHPHRDLHAVAITVNDLIAKEQYEEAAAAVTEAEGRELKALIELFRLTKNTFRESHREIAIVLSDGERSSAVVVDEVVSVEHLEVLTDNNSNPGQRVSSGFVHAISKRTGDDDELVLHLLTAAAFAA